MPAPKLVHPSKTDSEEPRGPALVVATDSPVFKIHMLNRQRSVTTHLSETDSGGICSGATSSCTYSVGSQACTNSEQDVLGIISTLTLEPN